MSNEIERRVLGKRELGRPARLADYVMAAKVRANVTSKPRSRQNVQSEDALIHPAGSDELTPVSDPFPRIGNRAYHRISSNTTVGNDRH